MPPLALHPLRAIITRPAATTFRLHLDMCWGFPQQVFAAAITTADHGHTSYVAVDKSRPAVPSLQDSASPGLMWSMLELTAVLPTGW